MKMTTQNSPGMIERERERSVTIKCEEGESSDLMIGDFEVLESIDHVLNGSLNRYMTSCIVSGVIVRYDNMQKPFRSPIFASQMQINILAIAISK